MVICLIALFAALSNYWHVSGTVPGAVATGFNGARSLPLPVPYRSVLSRTCNWNLS